MQPQGQDTPQPTPNSTPGPMPQDTPPLQAPQTPPGDPPAFNPNSNPMQPQTPPTEPAFAPPQHGVMPNTPAHQPKKSPVMLISLIVGAIVVIGGGILAYFLLFTGIALEAYNGEKFTMQVPVGYTKEEETDSVTFTEKGSKATASSVFAYYAEFPTKPTKAQLDTAKAAFKTQLETKIGTYASSTHTITDVKVEDTTYKGQDAIKVTGKAKSEGAEGVVKMIAVIDSEKIFIVGVAADGGDGGLIAKADEIINSFTIK
ncbi:MAG TPA: hypothetical protein VM581_04855 [Magnetospirillaceae bacterium]|nr:hypothetical protein [Magnetospirillaceae bacterium]